MEINTGSLYMFASQSLVSDYRRALPLHPDFRGDGMQLDDWYGLPGSCINPTDQYQGISCTFFFPFDHLQIEFNISVRLAFLGKDVIDGRWVRADPLINIMALMNHDLATQQASIPEMPLFHMSSPGYKSPVYPCRHSKQVCPHSTVT